jgi:RNA polymerase sigma-54 factor
MTPQLQQAIKLLQMGSQELQAYVEEELEHNPLLERDDDFVDRRDDDRSGAEISGNSDGSGGDDGDGGEAADLRDTSEFSESGTMGEADDTPYDADYDNLYDTDEAVEMRSSSSVEDWGSGGSRDFGGSDGDFEQYTAAEVTLRDHMTEQITFELSDPVERIVASHLLDQLDEAGYLTGDIEGVAELLNTDAAHVEAVLLRLQQLDPPGLFARNLGECLAAQLRDRNRYDPCIAALIDNLELVGKRDFAQLRKICNASSEDLAEMLEEIRKLDPKPGLRFLHQPVEHLVPDVLMRAKPGGGWIVELNPDALPRVLVNNQYHAVLSSRAKDRTEKTYISEQFQSANWLVRSLHQRATTILKVATELVRQQDSFFVKGISGLRPLVLRTIADAIEMHESTVSRVTANKYIATPRGIFEMRYFFTQAIAGTDGESAHSAEAVRHSIRALIDAEDPRKILSDDRIVELLRAEGIDIARRTVAKYREAMRIPSSVQRRREKAAVAL